ncbi:TRAP transporter large permease [Cloacibacillus porcorum]|uniref:TRAP transporter large permease n=1 Tax=Cloacibacillus porcorum TaxID=1197717 RepID=UPI001459C923|nr:TRAP transporter large permease [Cloacibacillus porcorum]MCC8183426.1 TRAP transporter large permease [Cloacibacillus porcorum]MDY5390767.1 TRAP transporter large permease [Cloacibacillus porcorum]NMF19118.1 TRAP transporter large permease [Cloacibacillus porcorum]
MVVQVLSFALAILCIMNVPIAICLGAASFLALYMDGSVPLLLLVQRMFTGTDSFTLLAIPLFMIAGRLMEWGGISKRLIDLSMNVVGGMYGGLANVSILACMFFAAISGSAPATVVAIGSIMVPAMIKEGYGKSFSVAILAAAGIIGVIIPPSILFVSYGVSIGASIGKLFIAGIIPGVIMGLSLMLFCYIVSRINGWKSSVKPTFRGFLSSLKKSIWGLLMPIIILGGIYGGIFTPTESAAVACIYSLFVGFFVYKELNIKNTYISFYEAGTTSAMVLLIIATATAMGWILTTEQVPLRIAEALSSLAQSRYSLLLFLNIMLLVTGCLMEPNAAIIILGPIFLPLLQQANIDLIHFGVVMVVNMAIGMLTPPLGVNLFVAQSLQKDIPIKSIISAITPMIIVLLVNLMLFTYIPAISTVLLKYFA